MMDLVHPINRAGKRRAPRLSRDHPQLRRRRPRLLLRNRRQMRQGPECYAEGRRGGRPHRPLLLFSTHNEETSRSLPCKTALRNINQSQRWMVPASVGAGCSFFDGHSAKCRRCQNPWQAGSSIGGAGRNFFQRTQRRASPVPASMAAGSSIGGAGCSFFWQTQRRASSVPAPVVDGSNIDGASCSILRWSVPVRGPRRIASVAAPGRRARSVRPPPLKQSPWRRLLGRKRICARGARELSKGGRRWRPERGDIGERREAGGAQELKLGHGGAHAG